MVRYYSEGIPFVFKDKVRTRRWLKTVSESEVRRLGDVSVVFCSDPYILDMNLKYLGHDYFTDIITFDYCQGDVLSGDLFISVDTVRENALFYGSSFEEEIHRVIVHGLLHLVGYDDQTDEQKKVMRSKENYYLDILSSL